MDDEMIGVVGPPMAAMLPDHLRLLLLTDGKRISQVVHVIAELGVADVLAAGPLPLEGIARACDADPDALSRVLRVAASFGVFTRDGEGRYALTPMAEYLRSDVPDSRRDLVLFNGDEMLWKPYGELLYTVRTGKPAFDAVFGRTFFEHLAEEPRAARLFDAAMAQMSQATTAMLLQQYDFGRFARVADIGGGNGWFLAELLAAFPGVRGTLVDLPDVVAAAGERFDANGTADRAEVVAGDFFEPAPPGFDAYLLKAVLHDWDDEHALRILGRIREAMQASPDGRLLVCEFLVAEDDRWDRGKLLDLDMLLRFGGRERDLAQWHRLLGAAGFELVNDPVPGRWAVLECRPVR